jgi:hypothetical protein
MLKEKYVDEYADWNSEVLNLLQMTPNETVSRFRHELNLRALAVMPIVT